MGLSYYRQEYCCSFESVEGLIYPDFGRCVVNGLLPPAGKRVGGIDFGFRRCYGVAFQSGPLHLQRFTS